MGSKEGHRLLGRGGGRHSRKLPCVHAPNICWPPACSWILWSLSTVGLMKRKRSWLTMASSTNTDKHGYGRIGKG
jgi:hypothetical protein